MDRLGTRNEQPLRLPLLSVEHVSDNAVDPSARLMPLVDELAKPVPLSDTLSPSCPADVLGVMLAESVKVASAN